MIILDLWGQNNQVVLNINKFIFSKSSEIMLFWTHFHWQKMHLHSSFPSNCNIFLLKPQLRKFMFNDVPLVTSIQEYNDASSSLTHTHTLYSSGLTMISLKICCFPRFLRNVSNGPTDRQMDGRTDRWTHPLIEMRGRIWKWYIEYFFFLGSVNIQFCFKLLELDEANISKVKTGRNPGGKPRLFQ